MTSVDTEQHLHATLPTWGLPFQVEERLGGGIRNDVRSVRLAGKRYAARQSSRTPESLDWELALLVDLDRTGLWVPTPLPTPDGRLHIDGLAVFTWMDGELPQSPEAWHLVEIALRALHTCTRDHPQRPGFRSARELLTESGGGDVHLDRMPLDVVALVRESWRPFVEEPQCVVHGDPNAENIRIANGRAGLLDWDEARVDTPLFDLAALLPEHLEGISSDRLHSARRAAVAWEVANGWTSEPKYAKRRLQELQAMLAE